MFFSWLKTERRKALAAATFPDAWNDWLCRNVRHYQHLAQADQARMRQAVVVIVAEKIWAGGSGFTITDEMKVTVAGQASVLTLGMEEPYCFDGVQSIILYAG
ncbi:MAG: zinc-dependent peptidase [Thermoguttaceae bacterium]